MNCILYRPTALQDIAGIFQYIAQDDELAARRVIGHIRQSIERLSLFPESGRAGVVPNTHELVISRYPYLVVYEIREDVEIVAVFHTAQDR